MLDRHQRERHEEEEQERFFREMAAAQIARELEWEWEEAMKSNAV